MLENLRRKSLTKTYIDHTHQVALELGYAHYENHLSIEQYKQKLSKGKITKPFPNTFDRVPNDFRLILYSLDNVQFNMIYCPSGTFKMEHKSEKNKQKKETIDTPFLLGETEITQELYEKVMGDNPSAFEYPQNPVETVSWGDAIFFCNKLSELQGLEQCYTKNSSAEFDWLCDFSKNGYRLPEEKEWEYAAKAGTQNKWSGTDSTSELTKYAVYSDNSKISGTRQPHIVKSKLPNEWGFYDMSGNVKEWCWDKYDPMGNASAGRVLRGGNWINVNSRLRSRDYGSPNYRDPFIGFRVCRSIVS